MEYFPGTLCRIESNELADRIRAGFAKHGFGLWAVEILNVVPFAGFVGLAVPRFDAHFTPCVEIGWRLAAEYWGRGYATEAALATLDFGLQKRDEIVSFTAVQNRASRRVMEKLGMKSDPRDDFDHPSLPDGHRLRRHVLYRITRSAWEARQQPAS